MNIFTEFYFEDRTAASAAYEEVFRRAFEFCARRFLSGHSSVIISLSTVGPEESRAINRDYRWKDSPADIITFAYQDDSAEPIDPAGPADLGEMVICPAAVKERALAVGNDFDEEMIYLFIHGFLHLIGYDHVGDEAAAAAMYALQDEVFAAYQKERNMVSIEKIKEECLKARELSYSPYSHFAVGAVVVLKSGAMIRGANIENSAYGLCMCAERNAIFNAYMSGAKKEDIAALALIASSPKLVTPCGSCRQVMAELLELDTPVYLWTLEGAEKTTTVGELLPFSFDKENL